MNISVFKSFGDIEVRAVDFQSDDAASIYGEAYESALKAHKMKMNDSSYLACSLARALVPHTTERDPGIQSRL